MFNAYCYDFDIRTCVISNLHSIFCFLWLMKVFYFILK